jgi:hypothetical protein
MSPSGPRHADRRPPPRITCLQPLAATPSWQRRPPCDREVPKVASASQGGSAIRCQHGTHHSGPPTHHRESPSRWSRRPCRSCPRERRQVMRSCSGAADTALVVDHAGQHVGVSTHRAPAHSRPAARSRWANMGKPALHALAQASLIRITCLHRCQRLHVQRHDSIAPQASYAHHGWQTATRRRPEEGP